MLMTRQEKMPSSTDQMAGAGECYIVSTNENVRNYVNKAPLAHFFSLRGNSKHKELDEAFEDYALAYKRLFRSESKLVSPKLI